MRDLVAFEDTNNDTIKDTAVIKNHIKYNAFGEIVSESNANIKHIFGFTARERDYESDLYYYRNRYYNPSTGRFLTTDPVEHDFENTYRYVDNDPVNFVDPSGLQKEFSMSQINAISRLGRSSYSAGKRYYRREGKYIIQALVEKPSIIGEAAWETRYVGLKAITNTTWKNTAGLFYDAKDIWEVTQHDLQYGYRYSRVLAEISFHAGTAVLPNKLAVLAKMAKARKTKTMINLTAKAINLYDVALNTRDIAKTSYSLYKNGANVGDIVLLSVSVLGGAADIKFLRDRLRQNRQLKDKLKKASKNRKLDFEEEKFLEELDRFAEIDDALLRAYIYRSNKSKVYGPVPIPPSTLKQKPRTQGFNPTQKKPKTTNVDSHAPNDKLTSTPALNRKLLHQAKALKKLGVDKSGRRAFFEGKDVMFQFPTRGGDPVIGLVQFQKGKLTSQLFSIKNLNPDAASHAFLQFRSRTKSLAKKMGATSIELQGGSVINPKIADFLRSQGFREKSIPVPESFGGGTQDVFFKIIKP